jgi:hypothetical protein
MASHKLVEIAVDLIVKEVQDNIVAALAEVAADRTKAIPIPKPTNVFAFTPVSVFRPPAIIVNAEEIDFRLGEAKANYIDALMRINVVAVCEEREGPTLQFAAYRYQAALHKILAQKHLYNQDNTVHIVCKVERARFSSIYTNAQQKDNPQGVFRKEVMLELEVEHYENLT